MKKDDRFLRWPEVMHRVGMRETKIRELMEAGKFPMVRHNGKIAYWLESEIEEWMEAQLQPAE